MLHSCIILPPGWDIPFGQNAKRVFQRRKVAVEVNLICRQPLLQQPADDLSPGDPPGFRPRVQPLPERIRQIDVGAVHTPHHTP